MVDPEALRVVLDAIADLGCISSVTVDEEAWRALGSPPKWRSVSLSTEPPDCWNCGSGEGICRDCRETHDLCSRTDGCEGVETFCKYKVDGQGVGVRVPSYPGEPPPEPIGPRVAGSAGEALGGIHRWRADMDRELAGVPVRCVGRNDKCSRDAMPGNDLCGVCREAALDSLGCGVGTMRVVESRHEKLPQPSGEGGWLLRPLPGFEHLAAGSEACREEGGQWRVKLSREQGGETALILQWWEKVYPTGLRRAEAMLAVQEGREPIPVEDLHWGWRTAEDYARRCARPREGGQEFEPFCEIVRVDNDGREMECGCCGAKWETPCDDDCDANQRGLDYFRAMTSLEPTP